MAQVSHQENGCTSWDVEEIRQATVFYKALSLALHMQNAQQMLTVTAIIKCIAYKESFLENRWIINLIKCLESLWYILPVHVLWVPAINQVQC